MREHLLDTLGPVHYADFLVYLMGPYKAFTVADLVADADETVDPTSVGFGQWDEDNGDYTEDEAFELLASVRDSLRDYGLNAFLAVDAEVDLDDQDAASQSIGFARASNVVALVAPHVGRNLGVGIETGAVLEALGDEDQERVVFVHESTVSSAMIRSLSRRWEATVYAYETEAELVACLRQFAVDVMHREQFGDLTPRGR